jgi:beta-glucosidase
VTYRHSLLRAASCALAFAFLAATVPAHAQFGPPKAKPTGPWMNTSLSPDQRADLLMQKLTLDQKIQILHGSGFPGFGPPNPQGKDSNGGAGYVPGFPEYGIPGIQMADAAYGVTRSGTNGRYSTALPSDLAAAATWNPEAAQMYGDLIGRELRDQGYTMSLGGGVNLTREPRDGRTFEYQGEDPLLAGTMVGNTMMALQATHMIGDIKHYAINDQESGRDAVDAIISHRAMRESDLLAFEIGLQISNAQGVMCSYNRINGDFACENSYLLTDVLKKDWKFPGFVLSDWGGTHSTVKASHAGLDNEEPADAFYGDALKKAVADKQVSMAELDDHVHRMLRAEFAAGIVDDPPEKLVVDVQGDLAIAKKLAEQSMVLLRNEEGLLPLDRAKVRTIAVIGQHADVGMVSGGGSAQVDPPGGNAIAKSGEKGTEWLKAVWFPDAPLKAITTAAPETKVTFDDATDPAKAAEAAKGADVAIVFVHQWESEAMDLKTLALSGNQDAVVEAVAAANPHTIVVLENGSPVLMPWVDKVGAIVESWYSGSDGANAVASVLFGDVNPSAKLPVTFPLSDADLPHPTITMPPPESTEDWSKDPQGMMKKIMAGLPPFTMKYDEGLEVGYKWYDAEHKKVLYPFGYGLSYTTYDYSGLKAEASGAGGLDGSVKVHLTVKNTGSRAGDEIAEVYTTMPAAAQEPPKRLVGWARVHIEPGDEKDVSIEIPNQRFAVWDEAKKGWQLVPGEYTLMAGPSSQELPLKQGVKL